MAGADRNRELRQRSALERVTDGIIALDDEFRYTYLNPRAEEILGRSEEELLGTVVWDAFPETADTLAESELTAAMEEQTERSFERYNEEREQWFDVRAYPDEGGLTIYFTDVTAEKESQRELEETNQQLLALVENTDAAVYIKDTDGHYELVNEAAASLFGLDPEDVVGSHDEELFDAESVAKIRAVDEEILATGEADSREAVRYIDGEKHVFLDNKYPYHDQDGDVAGIMGISRDITDRVERERELERKNDRLDEFASVISHDLRNPLNVARGRTTLLLETCDEQSRESLETVAAALDRMEAIIEDTLTLARQGETVGETAAVPIAEVVGHCWGNVETADAALEIVDEFTVRGDRGRLRQVFENLFRNAVEHGSTSPGSDTHQDAVEHGSTSPGSDTHQDAVEHGGSTVTVRVGRCGEREFYVEDDGPGIPDHERDQVFEAGQSSSADGTGFGLSIVNRIADAHGWSVRVTDGTDGGARFTFSDVDIDAE